MLTSYDHFAHENIIAHAQAAQALLHGGQIAASVDDARHHLHTLTLLLSDAPKNPCSVPAPRKGLGAGAGGAGLSDHPQRLCSKGPGDRRQRAGVMLLNITGEGDELLAHPQLFETWESYTAYLQPLLASGEVAYERMSSFS